jgi:hypothetical protein
VYCTLLQVLQPQCVAVVLHRASHQGVPGNAMPNMGTTTLQMGHMQGTPACKLMVFPHVVQVVSCHCSLPYVYNIVAK